MIDHVYSLLENNLPLVFCQSSKVTAPPKYSAEKLWAGKVIEVVHNQATGSNEGSLLLYNQWI